MNSVSLAILDDFLLGSDIAESQGHHGSFLSVFGFSRQEYWHRLPFSSPEDLPNAGIEPGSPALQADALPSEPSERIISLVLDKEARRSS